MICLLLCYFFLCSSLVFQCPLYSLDVPRIFLQAEGRVIYKSESLKFQTSFAQSLPHLNLDTVKVCLLGGVRNVAHTFERDPYGSQGQCNGVAYDACLEPVCSTCYDKRSYAQKNDFLGGPSWSLAGIVLCSTREP